MKFRKYISRSVMAGVLLSFSSCTGILSGLYDEPPAESKISRSGQLYIDASDWTQWHYIDLQAVSDSVDTVADFNPSSLWVTYEIPIEEVEKSDSKWGIYTYWYDVFGEGISKNEFHNFYSTSAQPQPESWTFAVHRNNVRTNGASVWKSPYSSFENLPSGTDWFRDACFSDDVWSETDVWAIQDRMLLGLIGNQGIEINPVLGEWLTMDIPPMPPVYSIDNSVFILRLADGTFAALQLADYVDAVGVKCHLTINYRYPL